MVVIVVAILSALLGARASAEPLGGTATEVAAPRGGTEPSATQPAASQRAPAGAWLGIQLQPDENGQGLVVVGIAPNSPAAAAGFQNEDVIIKIDNQDMKDVKTLLTRMRQTKPGDKLQFTVTNEGNERVLTATLAARPATQPSKN
jgi:S1-C subfamily serine protease